VSEQGGPGIELSSPDELFRTERDAMLRLAVLLVGSRQIAEEIVQDSFSAVLQRWDTLERPGAYLRAVVVNGCRMSLRRRETERRHRELDPPMPQDSPLELIELHEALASLPARQRVVVVLRYFADRSDAEIAESLGCRPATVRSLAHRGLGRLRKELA
jgi:RNA polymerase sigma-70 factor (sigma-E family)